jgi:hypothetical protein
LFSDHPGLADHLLDAYTESGKLKIWCTACLLVAEDQYTRKVRSLTGTGIWDDEVFCAKRESALLYTGIESADRHVLSACAETGLDPLPADDVLEAP